MAISSTQPFGWFKSFNSSIGFLYIFLSEETQQIMRYVPTCLYWPLITRSAIIINKDWYFKSDPVLKKQGKVHEFSAIQFFKPTDHYVTWIVKEITQVNIILIQSNKFHEKKKDGNPQKKKMRENILTVMGSLRKRNILKWNEKKKIEKDQEAKEKVDSGKRERGVGNEILVDKKKKKISIK